MILRLKLTLNTTTRLLPAYIKLDPKYAKIIALTTKVTAIKQSVSKNLANVTSGGWSGGGYRGNQSNKIAGVEKWRTVNKGATIQHKGKTVWWCLSNKHKDELFNGLYVWHKPEDHMHGLINSRDTDKKKDKNTAVTTADPPAGPRQGSLEKLAISQHLKEVLCYNLMLSDVDGYEYRKQVFESKYLSKRLLIQKY